MCTRSAAVLTKFSFRKRLFYFESDNFRRNIQRTINLQIISLKPICLLFGIQKKLPRPHCVGSGEILKRSFICTVHSRPRGRAPFGQHQESRPLILPGPTPEVRDSRTFRTVQALDMFRVKSDKSDWLWSQSIGLTKPFKNGMSLDLARGRDSRC